MPRARRSTAYTASGFTLVEVLVAITVLAVMALMTWRGIDGMLRIQHGVSQSDSQQPSGGLLGKINAQNTLQTSLAQWQTDLNSLSGLEGTPSWDWDGKVLRLTRHADSAGQGVRVVAWSWRADALRPGGGDWLRWQSAAVQTRQAWQDAWQSAKIWSHSPSIELRRQELVAHPLAGWQLYLHVAGSWSNPMSSDAAGAPEHLNSGRAPDGVRLILQLPDQFTLERQLTLDWMRPNLSGRLP